MNFLLCSRLGGVTFIHPFGSTFNLQLHFHVCLIDGIFTEIDGSVHFTPLPSLSQNDIDNILKITQQKVLKLMVRKGFIEKYEMEEMLNWNHQGGFSIDASVKINGNDRAGLERLLKYCARPIFFMNRLSWLNKKQEKLIYQLSKPSPNGNTTIILTPLELIDKLVKLVSDPKTHRHRYFGVLAPNSPMRQQVTALASKNISGGVSEEESFSNDKNSANYLWAVLTARIFEVFPLVCPVCGEEMRIIAFIMNAESIKDILEAINEPTEPPIIKPPRSPPDTEYDQYPDYDITEPEPIPDFEFDQTINW